MSGEPRIEQRGEQGYVGVRAVMPMRDFAREIPAMIAKVSKWIAANNVQASGKPFLRYRVVDMPERMDVELGIPVAHVPAVSGEVTAGALPVGRYAVLAYTGVKNGVAANQSLIDWIDAQGEAMASEETPKGQAFAARYETYPNADAEADADKRETEVAIKLRG